MSVATVATTLLAAQGASFGYGSVPVVHEVNIEVRAGELVALLGANGAGKTTTLLGLAGELQASHGQVHWLGTATRAPLHVRARQGMALVPGERAVTPQLTVRDNLRLGPGDPTDALALFPELQALWKRPAGLLSGGEQKMLTLARAVAAKPTVLLADELSLGLAPLAVRRLLEALRRAADGGIGVLLVEQQVRLALDVCDRAYIMRRGRMVMEGGNADLQSMMGQIEAHYLDESV